MAVGTFPESFRDPLYSDLDAANERKHGLPTGLLASIRENGERSNHSQVSSANATGVYQFIPSTAKAILSKYGLDVSLSPQNASEGAALLLKEGLKRNDGDATAAVGEYTGGLDRKNWGRVTQAYIERVMGGQHRSKAAALADDFGAFLKTSAAAPAAIPTAATPAAAPAPAQAAQPRSLEADFGQWLQKQPGQAPAAQIPVDPTLKAPPAQAPAPVTTPQSLTDRLIGAGETALTAITGATGGTFGAIDATVKGVAEEVLAGKFGTPEAANRIEQRAAQGMQELTYVPRTEAGREMAEGLGHAAQNLLPIAPLAAETAGIGSALNPVAQATARTTAQQATQAAKALPETVRKVPETVSAAVRSTLERTSPRSRAGGGSVGAAGTEQVAQRRATAADLPVPLRLTKGQETRDPAQLKFEVETAKMPGEGAPLRERLNEQNEAIMRNLDAWIDQSGAEAPSLRVVGNVVDKALVEQSKRDKTAVNVAYTKAKNSPEASAVVDQAAAVTIGDGDSALTSTPLAFLNEQPTGLPSTGLADAARQYAVKLGVADMQDGNLIPKQATIRQLEDWRKAINQATGYEPADVRTSAILKQLIDAQTEPVAGPLFRDARSLRTRYAQNYENRAAISKLLNTKRGTTDRLVAFEDVFDHAIHKGSLDDVRNLRRVLHRAGDDGAQAWKELQGATLNWLKEESTKGVATDARGNRIISPAGLDKAIRSLEHDGKLDFIFGKKGSQQLRDINELAQLVKTVPPEAGVNFSNTAATLLSAFADLAIAGASGTPAPLATMGRLAVKHVKDARLRRRIQDALNEVEQRAPGQQRPPQSAPSGTTVH